MELRRIKRRTPNFNQRCSGVDYNPIFDFKRLATQKRRVYNVMKDGHWHALFEIAEQTGDPEASISAQLRDFRKRRFGNWWVGRRRREKPGKGLFEYQLLRQPPNNKDDYENYCDKRWESKLDDRRRH